MPRPPYDLDPRTVSRDSLSLTHISYRRLLLVYDGLLIRHDYENSALWLATDSDCKSESYRVIKYTTLRTRGIYKTFLRIRDD